MLWNCRLSCVSLIPIHRSVARRVVPSGPKSQPSGKTVWATDSCLHILQALESIFNLFLGFGLQAQQLPMSSGAPLPHDFPSDEQGWSVVARSNPSSGNLGDGGDERHSEEQQRLFRMYTQGLQAVSNNIREFHVQAARNSVRGVEEANSHRPAAAQVM